MPLGTAIITPARALAMNEISAGEKKRVAEWHLAGQSPQALAAH